MSDPTDHPAIKLTEEHTRILDYDIPPDGWKDMINTELQAERYIQCVYMYELLREQLRRFFSGQELNTREVLSHPPFHKASKRVAKLLELMVEKNLSFYVVLQGYWTYIASEVEKSGYKPCPQSPGDAFIHILDMEAQAFLFPSFMPRKSISISKLREADRIRRRLEKGELKESDIDRHKKLRKKILSGNQEQFFELQNICIRAMTRVDKPALRKRFAYFWDSRKEFLDCLGASLHERHGKKSYTIVEGVKQPWDGT